MKRESDDNRNGTRLYAFDGEDQQEDNGLREFGECKKRSYMENIIFNFQQVSKKETSAIVLF